MQKLVNIVIPPINQPFIYAIEPTMQEQVRVGCQVHVSFGRRLARGFVVGELSDQEKLELKTNFEIKTINPEAKIRQCFDSRDLKFFSWIAEYYGESLSNIIDVAIPAPSKEKIEKSALVKQQVDPETIKSKIQRLLYEYLKEKNYPVSFEELRKVHSSATASLKKLADADLIYIDQKEVIDQHIIKEAIPEWTKSAVELNEKQIEALDLINRSILNKDSKPILLHGITGSGKTEVYIEAIQTCVKNSIGALVLVPEIALTPQLIDRFRARLGHDIAILHSALNQRVRWDSWRALLEQRNFVAIGARSGIFAPVPNLGLIIIDEEHETSYKQSEGLRYNARDLAIMRGKILGCPVVLGSATPSLETVHNAVTKKYHYLSLPLRHKKSVKESLSMEIVDLSQVKPWQMSSKNISPQLFKAIEKCLEEKGQVFILYNRRGFASYMQCETCEEVLQCNHCSVTLTFHKKSNLLVCHYCGLRHAPPPVCSACSREYKPLPPGKGNLVLRGGGTEKVYEELQQLFPNATVDRLDRDTVGSLESYKKILNDVRDGKTQILVGTQMIAKGHDLPGVTLVGIVDCDVGLHFPDFRAAERTYQLLTQAAGRAGRGNMPGKVILQSRVPKHHSLGMTLTHNFMGFAKTELANRKLLHYPPFTRLVRIVASSENQFLPSEFLSKLKEQVSEILKEESSKFQILGPSAAPLAKIKDHWRHNILIKSNSVTILNKIVRMTATAKAKAKNIKLIIDVDPQDML